METTARSMELSTSHLHLERSAGHGLSVSTQSSSPHPCDWGRAMAHAVHRLIDQITSDAGSDPCREAAGLNVTLNITETERGATITVTWLPTPADNEEFSPPPQ